MRGSQLYSFLFGNQDEQPGLGASQDVIYGSDRTRSGCPQALIGWVGGPVIRRDNKTYRATEICTSW